MYHRIVRRRTVAVFDALSRGAWDETLPLLHPAVHHVFPGDHPLGGERRSRDGVERWFGRLGRLFPRHEFTVLSVVASGPPWDTWVAVRWTAVLGPQAGEPYRNDGAHWIHLRWGRTDAFHAYLDTQRIAVACAAMAAAGVEEASAAPIAD